MWRRCTAYPEVPTPSLLHPMWWMMTRRGRRYKSRGRTLQMIGQCPGVGAAPVLRGFLLAALRPVCSVGAYDPRKRLQLETQHPPFIAVRTRADVPSHAE